MATPNETLYKIAANLHVHHLAEEQDTQKATKKKSNSKMRLTLPIVTAIIAVTVSLCTSEASPPLKDNEVLQVKQIMKVSILRDYQG